MENFGFDFSSEAEGAFAPLPVSEVAVVSSEAEGAVVPHVVVSSEAEGAFAPLPVSEAPSSAAPQDELQKIRDLRRLRMQEKLVHVVKRVEGYIHDNVIIEDQIYALLGHLYDCQDELEDKEFSRFLFVDMLLVDVEVLFLRLSTSSRRSRRSSPFQRAWKFFKRLCPL